MLSNSQKGFLRLTALLIVAALLPTLLAPLLFSVPVFNPGQPSLFFLPALLLGSMVMLYFFPSPLFVIWAALLCAGSAANTLHAAFSPVPDYIPLPWDTDHFLNVADLLIVAACALLPFIVFALWQSASGQDARRASRVSG